MPKEIKEPPAGPEGPASKSQRRREALEVKDLAARLIGLTPARLELVPLDGDLADAIREAQNIRARVARKRQLQYVAKLLRRTDPEPLIEALKSMAGEARQETARQHRCEAWRDRLLEDGDKALGDLIQQRGDTDRQAVRQLLRNAAREAAQGKPPASARALFRLLRDMDRVEALPPSS